ncbi:MAG: hypothetical protein Kow0090_05680 [Myxococcota bacterium]
MNWKDIILQIINFTFKSQVFSLFTNHYPLSSIYNERGSVLIERFMRRLFWGPAVAVVFFCLSATGEEITLWHSYRADEKAALDEIIEGFNAAQRDIKVVALALPYDAFLQKLNAAVPHGNGPDMFIFANEMVGSWAENNLILPLPAGFIGFAYENFFEKTVNALTLGGKLYGLPLNYKSVLLFYNSDIIPAPPATTDDMIAIAKAHTDPVRKKYGLAYEATSFYHNAGFIFGMGGSVFTPEGRVMLNTKENADALGFIQGLVLEHKIVPEEATSTLVSQLFNEGRAPMAINGPWFIGEIDKRVNYAVSELPVISGTGKPASPFLTVEGIFLASPGSRRGSSLAFMRHLATGESAKIRATKARQPVAWMPAYEDKAISEDPIISAFHRQMESAVTLPNKPVMRSVWEPAQAALRRVLRGAYEPSAALREADRQLAIILRPLPPPADPAIYVALFGLILLLLAGYLARTAYKSRAEIFRNKIAYAYMFPAVLAMALLVMLPFVVGSLVSLFTHRGGEFTFVGISNFVSIILSKDYGLTDPLSFYFTLAVTILWTAVNVVLHLVIGVFLAMLLRDKWLKLRGVYRVLLIVPWAVPNYITALIWKGMFHRQFGAINGALVALGFEPVSWFSKFSTAFAANVATNVWLGFPFMMVVTLGALQSIPEELEEAAAVDGASWWTRFYRITLPLLKPALLPAVVLGSVWTFNMFNIIYLVSGGEPDGSTEILISDAYRWAFTRQEQYGYAAAYAVLIFIVLFFYSKLTDKVLKPKETK